MISRLAENVFHFTRLLRGAGLRLGPAQALDALAAAAAVDVLRRGELYDALRATLVKRPEDFGVFDQAFSLFWRDPLGPHAALAQLLPHTTLPKPPRAVGRRVAEAWRQPAAPGAAPPPLAEREGREEVAGRLSYSNDEVLRRRDFEQMSAAELAQARRAAARFVVTLKPRRTRRLAIHPHGDRIDLARTARDSQKTAGDLAPLRFRRRRLRVPPLVVLCDISGSMGRYAEMLLCFLHALTGARGGVHVFLFATRLTPVTRLLRHRDVDEALARCGREVEDWAGGTRLRACLHQFQRHWARRVLAGGAVVLLVTDGLDRDSEPGLAGEAARLRRASRRLIWLNPLLRWSGFEPRAQGIRALLPHVDEHRPVHNLESLESLAHALAAPALAAPRRMIDQTPSSTRARSRIASCDSRQAAQTAAIHRSII